MKKLDEFRRENSEHVHELKRQLIEKEKMLLNYRREHGKLEAFFDRVIDSIDQLNLPKVVIKPKERKATSEVWAVMHVTDWHIGEIQNAHEIEGFNEFSHEIAKMRVTSYVKRFLDWVTLHRNVYEINKCAIIVTGDLISGDIHDELRVTAEFPSPVQVVRAAELLAGLIKVASEQFPDVVVEFIAEDNHARLTKKPQAKEAGYNSLNYLVGKMTQAYITGLENVEMNIYPMLEKVINVNGMRYLISHGHSVRGWMGVPWYGIERKVGKESQARLQLIMEEKERAETIGFDKYCIGHFHTPFDSSLYCCGGSLSGTSAYDHQAGRYSTPCQSAWMVHRKWKEFNRINFNLAI
jgi:hypothetical protein